MIISLSIVDIKHFTDSVSVTVKRSDTGILQNIAMNPDSTNKQIIEKVRDTAAYLNSVNDTKELLAKEIEPEKQGFMSKVMGIFK